MKGGKHYRHALIELYSSKSRLTAAFKYETTYNLETSEAVVYNSLHFMLCTDFEITSPWKPCQYTCYASRVIRVLRGSRQTDRWDEKGTECPLFMGSESSCEVSRGRAFWKNTRSLRRERRGMYSPKRLFEGPHNGGPQTEQDRSTESDWIPNWSQDFP